MTIDAENFIAYKLQNYISYQKMLHAVEKNPQLIPLTYLEQIDAKAAEKIRKTNNPDS